MKNRIIPLMLGMVLLLFSSLSAQEIDSPPPVDSITLVFSGVDYGGDYSSPQNYPNSKHITNVIVGSYYFPVVIWENGASWNYQSVFSYWDDQSNFWSFPDSFTSSQGNVTARGNVAVDSHGNLHFSWQQNGNSDGFEILYTRALLDTSTGVIQYNVERPAVMISATNGEEEHHSAMKIFNDTLIMIVYNVGTIGNEHALGYNYSADGGNSWIGPSVAYENGAIMPGEWILPCIASNPINGDMWVSIAFDYNLNSCMDIVALKWDASNNTWQDELAVSGQPIPNDHALYCPAMVVDYNGIPHIIFLEDWEGDGLQPHPQPPCGPIGMLNYTHRQGGNWSTPSQIYFPRYHLCNYCSGYPSVGIDSDNSIHLLTTQPESTFIDTSYIFPFNVYWAEVSPYTGAIAYGGRISDLPWGDTANSIYSHIPYDVPIASYTEGAGITWCQMDNITPPSDVYYCRLRSVSVEENPKTKQYSNKNLSIFPNPFTSVAKLEIQEISKNAESNLTIYNTSGRLVKSVKLTTNTYELGADLVTGIYFLKLNGKPVGKVVKVK